MSTIDPTKFQSKEAFESELLNRARGEAEQLWAASEKSRRLAGLHQELGFRTARDLIAALQQIAGIRTEGAPVAAKKEGRRTRVTLTDALRAQVKQLHAEGKKAPTIAKIVGLSTPTVYKIIG